MAALVFLKSAADITFLFMLMGSAAVHFGAGLLTCVITCAAIAVSEVLSYVISSGTSSRKSAISAVIRMSVYIIPLACIFLPGRSISWAVVCGLIWAYEIFTGASRRYFPEADVQKTIFRITLGALPAMLIILLMAGAREISFQIVIFSSLISLCCSVLIMRSLRHEAAVYSRPSYQAVNIVIVAVVAGISALLGSEAVVSGVLTALKAVYRVVAYAVLFVITYAIRGISYLVNWISLLFSGDSAPPPEPEPVTIDMRSGEDLFGEINEYNGMPLWLKITGIVIGALIAAAVIVFVFRRLAGRRAERKEASTGAAVYNPAKPAARNVRSSSPVQGVRKQYRKYLNLLESEGIVIEGDDTSEDVREKAPFKFRGEAADELRELYIDARYNGTADKAAADRAKELLREIKSTI